jgi:hypothetical protein
VHERVPERVCDDRAGGDSCRPSVLIEQSGAGPYRDSRTVCTDRGAYGCQLQIGCVASAREADAVKMHRNKILLILTVVVAALVAAVYIIRPHLAGSAHRIHPYTAIKLRVCMTQAQVEAILGAPPGDYSSEPMAGQVHAAADRRPDLRREAWTAEEGGAVIYFGKVADFKLWIVPTKRLSSKPPESGGTPSARSPEQGDIRRYLETS